MEKYRLFRMPYIGRRILANWVKKEGGAQASNTLRKYYSDCYKVSVDLYSYGGCFAPDFNTRGIVKIGRYTSIGPNVHYFGTNHPTHYASMSPYFYNRSFGCDVKDFKWTELTVGNDVWIGINAVITAGCSLIGNGAVIAAGSIVTQAVAPYSIVGGNPAKLIRMRFDEEVIQALEESQWYLLTPDELMNFYDVIDIPMEFALKVKAYAKNKEAKR